MYFEDEKLIYEEDTKNFVEIIRKILPNSECEKYLLEDIESFEIINCKGGKVENSSVNQKVGKPNKLTDIFLGFLFFFFCVAIIILLMVGGVTVFKFISNAFF